MDRIHSLKELLEESPKDSFLRHAMAMELQKVGADNEAITMLESLLQDAPDYVGSYYQLGKLLEKNGKDKEAIYYYEKGMEKAKQAGEKRTYNELRSALEELSFD